MSVCKIRCSCGAKFKGDDDCHHEADNNESTCIHCGFVAEEMLSDLMRTIEELQAEVLGLKTLREAEHVLMDAAEADNERLQATIKELQAELALLETNAIAQMEGYKRRIGALKAENGDRS